MPIRMSSGPTVRPRISPTAIRRPHRRVDGRGAGEDADQVAPARRAHELHRADRGDPGDETEQGPRRQAHGRPYRVDQRADRDRAERPHDARTVEQPRSPIAQTDRQRPLAGRGVGRDVPEVVRDEDRDREESEDRAAPPRRGRHPLVHHERRSRRRHQPEEDEDHDLAQTEAGVGARAAAVGERRDQRDRPDEQDQDRLRRQREREPREPGSADRDERRDEDGARRRGARRDEPGRTETSGRIHPPDAVEEVVRVVHADLEPIGHDQRGDEAPGDERLGRGGADHDGNEPRAQRPGARAGEPDVHGRFGNLEKSGGRFST